MTTPPGLPELPENALAQARELLHAALVDTFERVGWAAERVDPYPPATPKVPGGWVDAATLSRQGAGRAATFPLVVTVDSHEREQVRRLDALLAVLWERLEAVRIPEGMLLPTGSTLEVLAAGPDSIDVGGPTTRAITLTVQVPIGPRTLCPTALTTTGVPIP